jgi:hypothetical protein
MKWFNFKQEVVQLRQFCDGVLGRSSSLGCWWRYTIWAVEHEIDVTGLYGAFIETYSYGTATLKASGGPQRKKDPCRAAAGERRRREAASEGERETGDIVSGGSSTTWLPEPQGPPPPAFVITGLPSRGRETGKVWKPGDKGGRRRLAAMASGGSVHFAQEKASARLLPRPSRRCLTQSRPKSGC